MAPVAKERPVMAIDDNTQHAWMAELQELRGKVAELEQAAARCAQFEAELKRSEERFRLAAQCSNDCIYERDLETGEVQFFGDIDGCLGYAPQEFPRSLVGWIEHVHPDDLFRVLATIQEQLQRDEPYAHEYRLRRKNGSYADWWDRGVFIRNADRIPIKNIGAGVEITERNRMQAELRRLKEELERRVQERTEN
jgi:PAS domain S-box-containing protein